MKKLTQAVLVIGIGMVMSYVLPPDSYSSQARSNLLTIRIDQAGCAWWHEWRASEKNLPKPLFTDIDSCADSGCCLDYPACYAVLEDYIGRFSEAYILMIVHPEAHYMSLNNLLAVIDDIETRRVAPFDLLLADKKRRIANANAEDERRMNQELRILERDRGRGPDVLLGWWSERDNRILRFAADAISTSIPDAGSVPGEHQFKQNCDSSYWAEKFPNWLTVARRVQPPLFPNGANPTPTRVRIAVDSVGVTPPVGDQE